ncbi:hypothetical protein PIIN_10489 [Serendipita indica DSM 11827]|uniref:Uncharacterized protein n=1 Tax=Serendipita indica (strain DSM 11827) TaxID=1109443 RepID=G4TYV3_SERID|nr:hypothetical protein PIIN_10489 [Serendipita indica DSM 11827]
MSRCENGLRAIASGHWMRTGAIWPPRLAGRILYELGKQYSKYCPP